MTGLESSLGRTAHMIHDALVYSTVKAAARPPHSKLFQFAEPDVAVADWVVVVLQC
jgi:hypothetical protein